MINEKKQTVYSNYTSLVSGDLYTEFLKKDIETALNSLYDY